MLKCKHIPLITTILVMLFFYFPLFWMVLMSFLGKVNGGGYEWTLKWYDQVFHKREVLAAVWNTVIVGLSASVISTMLGTLSALAIYKYRSKLQEVHSCLLYIPLVLPEILMGLSLLIFFSSMNLPFGRGTVIAAHVAFCTSYVTVVIASSLDGFDFTLVEASRDLGATYFQSFIKVIFPLLRPAILAGTLLAFTLSLDDFIVTFFVSGHGGTTLPVYIYNSLKHGKVPGLYALSSVLLAVTFILVTISLLFTKNTQLLEGGENKA
ncbi:MAG: ABC transporter permease [Thermoguttaceae bacterium]|nr:ABC transporter permease [Thermoguttaceae bacterium]